MNTVKTADDRGVYGYIATTTAMPAAGPPPPSRHRLDIIAPRAQYPSIKGYSSNHIRDHTII